MPLGRARDGLARVLDIETAAAMASYLSHASERLDLSHASERLDAGEAVSGPAAQRFVSAARDAAARYEGLFLSPRQARALLTDPALQVHDNPQAFLACNYDPAKALCHPDRTAGKTVSHPNLDRCNPACANIARTDQQAAQLRDRALALETQAAHVPQPVGDRLRATAVRLRDQAGKHDRTRITTGKDAG